jgi:hypothetical protein
MAKVEIEEADFLASRQLTQAIQAMMAKPESRKKLLEAQKIVNPNAVTARDYQDEVLDEVRKERDERLAFQKKLEDDKAAEAVERRTSEFRSTWERQKQTVRERYPDLNDKGVEDIEKLAQDRGIPDLEAAAALYRQLNPPPAIEHPSGPSGFNLFDIPQQDDMKDHMKKLMDSGGENESELNAMIRETLADVRGQRRAA